ncbi:unnamed protein product [Phaedon cochleariae]|uniref:CD80-like immunoglobulin C2-set domain-containing protein n=1 Tax=Phaedon cochleariae TaxID=80249 RepID=A0A9P0DEZ4_PHACE|nr:unnamed protein product [Phaedon cochleariae]
MMDMCSLFCADFWRKLLVMAVLTIISRASASRGVSVTIPAAVKIMDTVTLHCKYDLEGEPLYTVKWYKGSKEFYRYIPKELPNTQMFPLPGIMVDMQKSSSNKVVLKNVQLEVSGRYKCEVSSDAPNFYTYMESGYMYVIDVPVDDPILRMDKEILDTGYRLKGNCSAPSSYPPANITWLLNGKNINGSYLKRLQPPDPFSKTSSSSTKRTPAISISGIELEIDENTFHGGKMRLSCVASIFNLYRRERDLVLEESRPRPRPSSVLGTRDASASGDMSPSIKEKLSTLLLITIIFIIR